MHIKGDFTFLATVLVLVIFGFIIFLSASMGLFARNGASFADVALTQLFFGLGLGTILMTVTYHIPYKFWRKHAFYIFIISLILTLLVFVPGIGFSAGGATRWINLGITTFQPSELLKIGFIIYFSAWISGMNTKMSTWTWGFLPLVILLGIIGLVLMFQPDTDTFMIIAATGAIMFFVSGARWYHVATIIAGGVGFLGVVALMRPYIMQRILTFLNPAEEALGASYQIQQSLIAIGSGGLFGRGFGQSIQKFNFLPEPIGDSIFAVAAEEFGFVGSFIIIALFVFFAYRGLRIAIYATDPFAKMLALGIVFLIITQSFLNIGAMVGVVPLAGVPLLFISHGGSALMLTLAEVGIVLNISKFIPKKT